MVVLEPLRLLPLHRWFPAQQHQLVHDTPAMPALFLSLTQASFRHSASASPLPEFSLDFPMKVWLLPNIQDVVYGASSMLGPCCTSLRHLPGWAPCQALSCFHHGSSHHLVLSGLVTSFASYRLSSSSRMSASWEFELNSLSSQLYPQSPALDHWSQA